jgi:hypothetical protein
VCSVIFRWGEGEIVDMAIFSFEVRRLSKRPEDRRVRVA